MNGNIKRFALAVALMLVLSFAAGALADANTYNYDNWVLTGGAWVYVGDDPTGEGMYPPPLPASESSAPAKQPAKQPEKEEPAKEEPVVQEPVVEEPVVEEPVADKPVADEPVADEPVADEPIADEPVADEPVADEPVAEEPVTEEPVVEEPVTEEPIVEEPVTEEPVVEEPVAEEPVVETHLSVTVTAAYEGESPIIGGTVTLISNVDADEETRANLTYQWQYRDASGEWKNVDGANGATYGYTVNEVNAQYAWRVVVNG